jgi:diguanylate cyclase (GGDEF)-like protein/PAS domain S-box-containing protein
MRVADSPAARPDSSPRANRSLALRRVSLVVGAMLVGILAGIGLYTLHLRYLRSAARDDALILLGRVATDAQRLRAVGLQTAADGGLSSADRVRMSAARRRLALSLDSLRTIPATRSSVDSLRAGLEVYLSGSAPAPIGAEVDARLARLHDRYTGEADQAERAMLLTAAALLFVSTGLVCLLVWRQDAARRTARELALQERVLRENEVRFRSLVQHSSDIISVVDADWRAVYCSPAVLPCLGFSPEEMEGVRVLDLVHEDDGLKAEEFVRDVVATPGETRGVVWRLRHADGNWMDVETVATNLLADPVIAGIVLNTRDVSERVALETRLTHQASHDALTNLANRALFRARVERALERAEAQQRGTVVLFLDLDDFKAVNDTLGHDKGDKLLAEAAERFLSATRGRDLVARFGGDEFAILLENVQDVRGAVRVAERVAQALREPFRLAGREVFVSSSIGLAYAEPAMSADELLRNADVAMYAAKNRGKGRFEVFHAEMHAALIARMELEGDLRATVERGEIQIAYLPLVDLDSGAMRGVEALARWTHHTRGPIPPSVFVPIAEETGLILPLGRHVLMTACRTVARWQTQLSGESGLAVNVNVSPRQLLDPEFVEDVRTALVETGLTPGSLALEITEGSLLAGSDVLRERLERLRALGVSLVLDDFGTGYASLSNLQRFSVDAIKVDRAFVERVAEGGVPAALAAAVLSFGRSLGLRTVAEGVETADQMQLLRSLGCDDAQGFLFTQPLDADRMEAMLRAQRVMEPEVVLELE